MDDKDALAILERNQIAVTEEIARIKDQLGHAKSRAAESGEYSDSGWYRRANRALKHRQIEHQELLRKAADLRKKIKAADQAELQTRFERAFINAARDLLDAGTYQQVLLAAQATQ